MIKSGFQNQRKKEGRSRRGVESRSESIVEHKFSVCLHALHALRILLTLGLITHYVCSPDTV